MKLENLKLNNRDITLLSKKELVDKYALSLIEPDKYKLTNEETECAKKAADELYEARQILNEMASKEQLTMLTEINQANEIATYSSNCINPTNSLEKMLVDQMAALHIAGMGILSNLNKEQPLDFEMMNKVTNASCKLFKCYHNAMLTLNQARNGGKQTITVKHQNVQVNNGQAVIADTLQVNQRGVDNEK